MVVPLPRGLGDKKLLLGAALAPWFPALCRLCCVPNLVPASGLLSLLALGVMDDPCGMRAWMWEWTERSAVGKGFAVLRGCGVPKTAPGCAGMWPRDAVSVPRPCGSVPTAPAPEVFPWDSGGPARSRVLPWICDAQVPRARCPFSAVASAGDACGAVHGDNPTIPAQEFRQGHQQRWGPAQAEPRGRRAVVGSRGGEKRPGEGPRLSGHIPEFPWMWQQGELELLL